MIYKIDLQKTKRRPIPYEFRYPACEFIVWCPPDTKRSISSNNSKPYETFFIRVYIVLVI